MKAKVNEISQKKIISIVVICQLGNLHRFIIFYLELKLYKTVSVKNFNVCAI